jgi:hypothetical protein
MSKMIDKIRRKRVTVNPTEYEEVKSLANAANEILNNPRFSFFREYIDDSLKSIESSVLENSIKDVKEEFTISDKFKKIFFTPKKVQIDELSGSYKWIKKMLKDLETFSQMGKKLEDKIAKKEVVLSDE